MCMESKSYKEEGGGGRASLDKGRVGVGIGKVINGVVE